MGLACAGFDAARDRLCDWAARAEASSADASPVALPPRQFRARAFVIGLVVTVPPRAREAASRLRDGALAAVRVGAVLVRPLLWLGPVRAAADTGLALRARTAASVTALCAVGEREAARCERIARLAAREMVEEVMARVGEAAEVREVLVEQSAGIAAETLSEVRRQADRADALVETAARAFLPWRRRGGRRGDGLVER